MTARNELLRMGINFNPNLTEEECQWLLLSITSDVDPEWEYEASIAAEYLQMVNPMSGLDKVMATTSRQAVVVDVLASEAFNITKEIDIHARKDFCKVCGKEIAQAETGRPKEFCANACKQKAYRAAKKKAA